MAADDSQTPIEVRYQPDESPPPVLSISLGLQLAMLCVAGIVFTPAIVIRAAGGSESFLVWAVFAAVAISGVSTLLQVLRVGRVGSGYVLPMGTSGAFIAVCIAAMLQGGPALMATLVLCSSLLEFIFARRLSLFRRMLTPAVTGTVIMLIPVTVMPAIFDMLTQVEAGAPAPAAPLSALATLLVMIVLALTTVGVLRLWSPVFGVLAGSLVAGYFGLYEFDRIAEAAWFGLPQFAWPGLDLGFGPSFWALLPAFLFVTLISGIETVGDSVVIQQLSWRRPRAVDFRAVQGALNSDGVGNLLAGLVGTIPNTTYSTGVSVAELTRVGARKVGIATGAIFLMLAFLPKLLAVLLAIPGPVAAAYTTLLMAMLFVIGIKTVIRGGLDYRQGLIVGISFWIGVGFQNQLVYPELVEAYTGGLLHNGMTAGGLVAVLMTGLLQFMEPARRRAEFKFDASALSATQEFLREFAARTGWEEAMLHRLHAASEEVLLILDQVPDKADADAGTNSGPRRLQLVVYRELDEAVLEFVVSGEGENLQDQIAVLSLQPDEAALEREISLRLLRHYASSVRHQQFHDTAIVTIRVEAPGPVGKLPLTRAGG